MRLIAIRAVRGFLFGASVMVGACITWTLVQRRQDGRRHAGVMRRPASPAHWGQR